MRYGLITILFTLLIGNALQAQQFVGNTASTQVRLDESFTVDYTLNAIGSDFRMPDLKDFILLGGPVSSSNSININGRRSQSASYSFILQAKTTGKFVIPPASIVVHGKLLKSNTISIEVLPPLGSSKQSLSDRDEHTEAHSDESEKVFLKVQCNKKHVVQGDAVVVSYKLYLRNVQLDGYNLSSAPTFDGFWAEDINLPGNVQMHTEMYKGKKYQVGVIKKVILFPQKSGKLKIDPLEIVATGQNAGNLNPMDAFFQSGDPRDFFKSFTPFQVTLNSKSLELDVSPVPVKKAPANFSGFVGKASVNSAMTQKEAKVNDAITYTLTVQGAGNLKLLSPPKLQVEGDVEVYDPVFEDKIVKSNDNLMGSKVFKYTLIPHKAGSIHIPAQNFCYYDPEEHTFEISTTEPYTIEIAPVEKKPDADSDVMALNTDNKKITKPAKSEKRISFLYIASLASLPIMAGFVFLLVKTKRKKAESIEAPKIVEKRIDIQTHLTLAKTNLTNNDREGFYKNLQASLYEFIHKNTGLSLAIMNEDNIKEALLKYGMTEEKVGSYLLLLERISFAKYAPSGGHLMQEECLLAEAERLMS